MRHGDGKPRFTDQHRFPHGDYVPARETDVAKTFARIKNQIEASRKEAKTIPIKRTA